MSALDALRDKLGLESNDYYIKKSQELEKANAKVRKTNQIAKETSNNSLKNYTNQYNTNLNKINELTKQNEKEKRQFGIKTSKEIADNTISSLLNFNYMPSSQNSTPINEIKKPTQPTMKSKQIYDDAKLQTIENASKEKEYKNVSETNKQLVTLKNENQYVKYQKENEEVNQQKTTFLDKINLVNQYLSGLQSASVSYNYVDDNGNHLALPSKTQLKAQKTTQDSGFLLKAIQGAATSLGSMTPAMLAKVVGDFAGIPGLPEIVTLITTTNSATNRKLLEGYDKDSALKYGIVNGTLEAGLGTVLGGASKILTGKESILSNSLGKVADKIFNNQGVSYAISHLTSEEIEELMQDVLDPINEMVTLGEYNSLSEALSTINGEDLALTALSTLISMGVTEGPTAVKIGNLQKNIDKVNKEYGTDFKIKANENTVAEVVNNVKNTFDEETNNTKEKNNVKEETNNINEEISNNRNINNDNNKKIISNMSEEINNIEQKINNNEIEPEVATKTINELKNDLSTLKTWQESQNIEENSQIIQEQTKQIDDLINKVNNLEQNVNKQDTSIKLPINKELANSSFSMKQQQLNIIKKNNPMQDDYHTGIRSVDDIKTWEEVLELDDESEGQFAWGDYSREDAEKALKDGKITIYSSYPIEQGTFVSTSYVQAEEYAGGRGNKVYEKIVPLTEVAWINGDEGQYAKIQQNIPTIISFQQEVKLPTTNENDTNITENINNNVVSREIIDKYESATGTIDRYILLKVADTLDIHYKDGATVIIDENMAKRSGNNKNPLIIDASVLNRTGNLSDLTREINNLSRDMYTNNENGYTLVNNIDTNTNFELGNLGIDKTFSKNVPIEKLPTFNKLKEIGEQGVYYRTSYDSNKNDGIFYHHFLTPIKAINTEGNAFIRTVIKEYTKDNNMNNKFYYHQIEYLDNQKGITDTSHIGTRTFDNPLHKDNTTNEQKSQIVLPSNNSNMQNNEKNDIKLPINASKILDPVQISKLTKEDANTTPILPKKNVDTGNGKSKFVNNIQNKTDMLTDESKSEILSSDDVKYYKEVTNQESLEKAYEKLNSGGQNETISWINKDTTQATSIDVAEGWILLKQYQDQIKNETDIAKKDELNRSMVEVAKHLRDIGTKSGQTVQAFNILNRMTPEGMVYYAQSELSEAFNIMSKNKTKEWLENNKENFELAPEETQFIMDTMKEVQEMEDGYDKRVKLAQIQKIISDKIPSAKGTAIKSWMRISMLFNPKTQVRNVMGNALIAPINSFGDLFASTVDKQIAKKTGIRTTGKTNLKNYLEGSKRGFEQATHDYKLGINTKDMNGNRFELTDGKAFNEKTIFGKGLNKVNDLLSYTMDAGDRIFSEGSFQNSLKNQLVLNNTTAVTQDMIDIATSEALSRTWNDNNNYTRFVINVRNGLNKLANFGQYGLGDVLIPFAKTPANLTKAIVDYSPLGFVNTLKSGINLKNSLNNGQYNAKMQHQFVQNLGKATAGSMLYILGIALAKAGITTGESDDDKDVANFLKNTLGINSYSIKIGNKTFTYDWAQPLASPLSITANVVNSKNKDQALLEGIVNSLDTGGSILLEQSFLQSLNDVLNNNDGVISGLIAEILELPSRAIPTFSKQLVDLTDSSQRSSYEYGKPIKSAVNTAIAKIPGLSKKLAPSVDTMGREIQRYGGKNNLFNVFLNPANVNTENISQSAEEIYRLYKETGDATIMPRVAPYYLNKNGKKIVLTSKQKADYQKVSGNIIEENIQKLLKNNDYEKLSDIEKADLINNIVNYSYNVAQNDVLGLEVSSTYKKPYLYSKVGNITDYYMIKTQDFASDKDKNGEAISGSKKNKVVNYINSMNLTVAEKAMLIKLNNYTLKGYDKKIIEYVNNKNLTKEEKQDILEELGYTIKDGKVY